MKYRLRFTSIYLVSNGGLYATRTSAFPNYGHWLSNYNLYQNQKIRRLESRINTLLKSAHNGEDERLVYLQENLSHLDKIKAIKALRDHYPELGFVEANKLWEQNQSNAKILR